MGSWEIGNVYGACWKHGKFWSDKKPLKGHRALVYADGRRSEDASMKLALILAGLLATTGVVYAACMFC